MLTRSIQLRTDTIDGVNRSVRAVVSTENAVEVWDSPSRGVVLEILLTDGCEVGTQCPFLTDHERSVPTSIGSARDFRKEADGLTAQLSFASGVSAADEAWALVSQRHLRDISAGYQVLESTTIPAGRSAIIRGRKFTAPNDKPLRVVTAWRLKECSLVPIGADPAAQIRSLPSISFSDSKGTKSMTTTLSIVGRAADEMTLAQYGAACLKRRGLTVPENDLDTTRAAFSGVVGLADLQGIVNSAILAGYRNASDSLADIYQLQSASNYLLGELGVLSVHPRLGRIARGESAPSAAFALSSTGYRLAKYGVQFCVDEQDIEDNRNLGVYQLALAETGAAFRQFVQDMLWSVVLNNPTLGDGTALFATGRGNLGAVALSDANLDAAMAGIAGQTGVDENSEPIHLGLMPRFLIVPPAKLGAAKRLVRDMQTGDSTDLIVRPESRLSITGMVNPTAADDAPLLQGNDKNWLLAAPAAQAPSVVLAALNGRVEPSIRAYELDQGQWRTGFDISLSVAAAAVDGKPLYWSAGE